MHFFSANLYSTQYYQYLKFNRWCVHILIIKWKYEIFLIFVIIDNDMKEELAGTTANVVLLKGNRIFCVSCKGKNTGKNTGKKKIYFCYFYWFICSIAKELLKLIYWYIYIFKFFKVICTCTNIVCWLIGTLLTCIVSKTGNLKVNFFKVMLLEIPLTVNDQICTFSMLSIAQVYISSLELFPVAHLFNIFVIMESLKGNVGDSRCVASVRGQVEQLSFDHKPGNETETKRIISAGGWVEFNRVNGKIQSL